MRVIDATATAAALPWSPLVEALRDMFRTGCEAPVRHHHDMAVPGEPDATLLLMPAWRVGDYIGVKIVNVVPGNGARGLPAISAAYLLSSARTGEILSLVDGGELTARRTAAASALAADYLARPDSETLLVVGTGRLAPNLVQAHRAVRPSLKKVLIWGRDDAKAAAAIEQLGSNGAGDGLELEVAGDLPGAVGQADIVSCATLSTAPLVLGDWLRPGTHVDLVGAFKPSMRESDDDAIRRSTVFVDTRTGATKEAGDIVQALESGALAPEAIAADLFDLTGGAHPGRTDPHEITLFKSVGASLEDLAGAILVQKTVAGAG